MATASALNLLRMPARLVKNPTDLSTTFPYGGTALGLARELVFRFGTKTHAEYAEEWATHTRVFYCGDVGYLAAILRDWDVDAIGNVFVTGSTGSSGGPLVAPDVNASTRAGTLLSGSSILVAPLAPDVYPAVLLYNALPHPEDAAELNYSRKNEAGVGAAWEACPDANGRTYAVGVLEDLTL